MSGGEKDDWREDLEKRVEDLERSRAWLMGLFAGMAAIGAVMLDKLKKLMGLG